MNRPKPGLVDRAAARPLHLDRAVATRPTWTWTALALGAALLAGGCSSGHSVTLNFRATVGSQEFLCGQSYAGLGGSGSTFTPTDFRFYVSSVQLLSSNGGQVSLSLDQDGVWQQGAVALLDFENKVGPCTSGTPEVNRTVTGTVPDGAYSGLRFSLGLPANINHQDTAGAAPPLNVPSLWWPAPGGYKFLRVEGTTPSQPSGWNVDLGSSECTRAAGSQTTSCAYENLAQIELSGFDPRSVDILADLNQLLSGVNLDANTTGTAPGCMSDSTDPDCATIFHNLGLRLGSETGGPYQQRFFRVQ